MALLVQSVLLYFIALELRLDNVLFQYCIDPPAGQHGLTPNTRNHLALIPAQFLSIYDLS